MPAAKPDIKEWESTEVERSLIDAGKQDLGNLEIGESIIERYLNPPADTAYALEYACYLLGDVSGKTVLDYGCGAGSNSVLIASHGGSVIGVDISPELIAIARRRLEQHKFKDHRFEVGSAHELPLGSESVDVVFGKAILHHLDLSLSSREVFRVLKSGGRAVFIEPVRNSRIIRTCRKLIPYRSPAVSPYERPLTEVEIERFAARFSDYQSRAFSLPFVNLIEALGLPSKILHTAIGIDGVILKHFPVLKEFAAVRVVQMRKA